MKRILPEITILFLTLIFFSSVNATEKDFEGYFTFKMTVINPDKVKGQAEEEMNMTFYFKGKKTLIDFQSASNQHMKILIDREKELMYQLMNPRNQKMAMKMRLDQLKKRNQESDMGKKDLKTKASGKTKSILGHECKQINVTSEDVVGHVWVTNEVNVDLGKIFGLMNKHPRNNLGQDDVRTAYSYPFQGFVMEGLMENKEQEDHKIKTKVTELEQKSLKAAKFDVSDYRIMDMGGGMNQDGR